MPCEEYPTALLTGFECSALNICLICYLATFISTCRNGSRMQNMEMKMFNVNKVNVT